MVYDIYFYKATNIEIPDINIINLNNDLSVNINYTTSEVVIGTWIDGKTLFRRVIDCGALPNTNTKIVKVNDISIDKVVYMDGYTSNGTHYLPLPYVYGDSSTIDIIGVLYVGNFSDQTQKYAIHIVTKSNRTSFTDTKVTIYYTKTS